MLTIELGELYGMSNEKELFEAIEQLRRLGMSDADIQVMLERSKEEKK